HDRSHDVSTHDGRDAAVAALVDRGDLWHELPIHAVPEQGPGGIHHVGRDGRIERARLVRGQEAAADPRPPRRHPQRAGVTNVDRLRCVRSYGATATWGHV